MFDLPPPARLPLLAFGMLSLLGGVLAGLARLDWNVPTLAAAQAGNHGALMIAAFFGTVISLERAVALGRLWAYLAPAAAGLGGVAALLGSPARLVQFLAIVAASVLLLASVQVLRRQIASFTLVLALASFCWLVGNLLWQFSGLTSFAVPWWLSFLVLTIAGERLELTRFLPTPPLARRFFLMIVLLISGGAALACLREDIGLRVFSAGLLALALWLLRYDIARRNVVQRGLTRFMAICLLTGYFWLAVAGFLGISGGFLPGDAWRDATLHTVGIGFVFSMVFGHAPVIFPAVARVRIPYHPVFFLPLLALHSSLLLRVAGVLINETAWQTLGGLFNALALLLFVGTLMISVWRGAQGKSAIRR